MQSTMNGQQPDRRKPANLRLALILASIAAVMFLGFVAKTWFLGHH